MALSTPWSQTMRLRVPLVNAPMGGVAGGALAAAVSAAGGLGMIGVGSAGSAATLEREVEYLREAELPFGIGLLDWAVAREPALLTTALAASPVLISVSFGDDWSWTERARDLGIVTATQVFDLAGARRAEDSGIEVLVARGAEGGGHGDAKVGTLPLLEAVLETVTTPVLAAGGISSARGLAAVLAAGASGAWLGTAFAACTESLTSARGATPCSKRERPTPSRPGSSTSPSATRGRPGSMSGCCATTSRSAGLVARTNSPQTTTHVPPWPRPSL